MVEGGFSALQRAEIAEIRNDAPRAASLNGFSALQRAEIAEIQTAPDPLPLLIVCFSALQRAEIAEIVGDRRPAACARRVSVLFNEPKLLKSRPSLPALPVSQILIPARRRS